MGKYVPAGDIRPGDYVSGLGHGFMDYRVTDIVGIHQRTKSNDNPWTDERYLSIRGKGGGIATGKPDTMVWRTYARPAESPIGEDGSITVNGLIVGRIELKAEETAFEYVGRNYKREIIGGPTGYVWQCYDSEGNPRGKAISYAECLESMVHCALMDQAKTQRTA